MMSNSISDRITASRKLLQDPYAYLDDTNCFDALAASPHEQALAAHAPPLELIKKYTARESGTPIKPRYATIEIEQRARSLQASLWQDRSLIWPDATPTNPINVLDPFIALRLLGYDCELDETLGQFINDGKPVEVAATLDRKTREVHISRQFSNTVRNFTVAHELGHALLHDTGTTLHRDRPLDGATLSRSNIEFEADKFASFFLMPAKQVLSAFERFFLTDLFVLNEATAFALGRGDYEELHNQCRTLRQLSRLIAGAEQYNGLHFISLADQFLVTDEAMAIRLEELGLVSL